MVASVVEAVQGGYIVRARADSDTLEARAGYTGRRDAMFASGAHVVASDFVLPAAQHRAAGSAQALFSTDYRVALPGGLAGRCLLPNVTSGSGGSTAAVRLDAVGSSSSGEDGIYCGTLEAAAENGSSSGGGGGVALPSEQPSGGAGGSTTDNSPASTPTEQQEQEQQPDTTTNGGRRPALPAALAAAAGLFAAALAAL